MQKFVSITSQANQPNFAKCAEEHAERLNNYITNGFVNTNKEYERVLNKPTNATQTKVCSSNTVQWVNNMTIYITTILCCE